MANVLVVGGAGYVGSAVCAWLIDRGHKVFILDDLSTGRSELILGDGFVHARAGDHAAVLNLLKSEDIETVMHFAARSIAPESFEQKELYFENNVEQTKLLLATMIRAGVRRLVFSSSAAVFGTPAVELIDESTPTRPINPYGETKLAAENLLTDWAERACLQAISLRYFNAAGAEPALRVGEWHQPETHLLPKLIQAALDDQVFAVHGLDYPTPDGSCIRDYVHVSDLAQAHEAAMFKLLAMPEGQSCHLRFNLGSEKGFSVLEVIDAAQEVLGFRPRIVTGPRRPGDPPRLVASAALARKQIEFMVEHSNLKTILTTALQWEIRRRQMTPSKPV